MKKIILVFAVLALAACAGGKQYSAPPDSEKIAEVSDAGKCTFIKKASARGMRGLNLTRNIQSTVYNLGGDSYKIISTSIEVKGSASVTDVKFQVLKCK